MNKCRTCNVLIGDDTELCPLCKCVLEKQSETENAYPDVWLKNHKWKLVTRIYLFVALIVEAFLIYINYRTYDGFRWSVIVGCLLAYLYLTFAYMVNNTKAGYRMKIFVGVMAGAGVLALIDEELGYTAWSSNYALPVLLMAIDITILFFVCINRRNWHSYLIFQIIMIVVSLACLTLQFVNIITKPTLSYVALAFSVACFLGTLIIGGESSIEELKRRFHI